MTLYLYPNPQPTYRLSISFLDYWGDSIPEVFDVIINCMYFIDMDIGDNHLLAVLLPIRDDRFHPKLVFNSLKVILRQYS